MADPNYVPQATLYEHPGQVEFLADLPTSTPIPDLSSLLKTKSASSAKLTGAWVFYEHKNYNAGADARVEYFYETHGVGVPFRKLAGNIGSARYVGNSQDCRSDTISFYNQNRFQGAEVFVDNQNPSVTGVASFVITGSSAWTVYDEPNYKGNSITFKPRHSANFKPAFVVDLAEVGLLPGTIKSVQKGHYAEKLVEIEIGGE